MQLDMEINSEIERGCSPFLFCKVGYGVKALFWHDDLGPLIDLSGANRRRVSRISRNATVANAILDGRWILPRDRHPIILLLKAALPVVHSLISTSSDEFLWTNTITSDPGRFSSAFTWNKIHQDSNPVTWWKSVWFTYYIPTHFFLLCMIIKDRLLTRDKLLSWGLDVPSDCLLCDASRESRSHIYFSCPYSSQIFRGLFCHHGFNPPSDLLNTVNWIVRASSLKKVKTICSLVLQAIVYEVWKERNAQIHSTSSKPASVLIKEIQLIIRNFFFHGHSRT